MSPGGLGTGCPAQGVIFEVVPEVACMASLTKGSRCQT